MSALALPSRHTAPESTEAAATLARNLGLDFRVLPIDGLHGSARGALRDLVIEDDAAGDIVDENLQARLRALVLLAFVNRHGGVLLNTSNRTERALGYGTLNGDLAGTLAVLGDVPKPLVYALARWHAKRFGSIPPFVLDRPPTAELAPGQVDPFAYDRVAPLADALLRGHAVEGPLAEDLRRRVRAAEHKRAQGGIVLQVDGDCSGLGRLLPVTRAV